MALFLAVWSTVIRLSAFPSSHTTEKKAGKTQSKLFTHFLMRFLWYFIKISKFPNKKWFCQEKNYNNHYFPEGHMY